MLAEMSFGSVAGAWIKRRSTVEKWVILIVLLALLAWLNLATCG